MPRYRCPDASHSGRSFILKSNNEKIFECEESHRFFKREDGEKLLLVDLISGKKYDAGVFSDSSFTEGPTPRARLNFMVDIPKVTGVLDFNRLSLSSPEWKMISKMDGRANLEEVRLLAGLRAEEAEQILWNLMDKGLVEIRRRGR